MLRQFGARLKTKSSKSVCELHPSKYSAVSFMLLFTNPQCKLKPHLYQYLKPFIFLNSFKFVQRKQSEFYSVLSFGFNPNPIHRCLPISRALKSYCPVCMSTSCHLKLSLKQYVVQVFMPNSAMGKFHARQLGQYH